MDGELTPVRRLPVFPPMSAAELRLEAEGAPVDSPRFVGIQRVLVEV